MFHDFLKPKQPGNVFSQKEYWFDAQGSIGSTIRDPLYEVLSMRVSHHPDLPSSIRSFCLASDGRKNLGLFQKDLMRIATFSPLAMWPGPQTYRTPVESAVAHGVFTTIRYISGSSCHVGRYRTWVRNDEMVTKNHRWDYATGQLLFFTLLRGSRDRKTLMGMIL